MAVANCIAQRGTIPSVFAVEIGTGVKEQNHDGFITHRCRKVRTSPIIVIRCVHFTATLDEKLKAICIPRPYTLAQLASGR
mmetsp:Transcript_9301/g.24784  ORF Transcript_9301/g.24784 Transcript_9301/m.24784 type:complete len:81 (+) Transcript_9301:977-1219(+)